MWSANRHRAALDLQGIARGLPGNGAIWSRGLMGGTVWAAPKVGKLAMTLAVSRPVLVSAMNILSPTARGPALRRRPEQLPRETIPWVLAQMKTVTLTGTNRDDELRQIARVLQEAA